jgi:hypothetical protein
MGVEQVEMLSWDCDAASLMKGLLRRLERVMRLSIDGVRGRSWSRGVVASKLVEENGSLSRNEGCVLLEGMLVVVWEREDRVLGSFGPVVMMESLPRAPTGAVDVLWIFWISTR